MNGATLKFPAGTMAGFTGTQTAGFNDVQPVRIVRELLQNSLDAAVEAGEKQAVVHFTVTRVRAVDLPDIAGYECAFEDAVAAHEQQGGLSDAAQEVVDTIRDGLGWIRDDNHYLLGISDNGVGLDDERMTALLSDGASHKDSRQNKRFILRFCDLARSCSSSRHGTCLWRAKGPPSARRSPSGPWGTRCRPVRRAPSAPWRWSCWR